MTLVGPNAVLDCAGNWIVGDTGSGFAVRLEGGATAMNCKLSGFQDSESYMHGMMSRPRG